MYHPPFNLIYRFNQQGLNQPRVVREVGLNLKISKIRQEMRTRTELEIDPRTGVGFKGQDTDKSLLRLVCESHANNDDKAVLNLSKQVKEAYKSNLK